MAQPITPSFPLAVTYPESDGQFLVPLLSKERLGEVLRLFSAARQNGVKELLGKMSGLELQRVKPHCLWHLSRQCAASLEPRRGLATFPVPLLRKERLGKVLQASAALRARLDWVQANGVKELLGKMSGLELQSVKPHRLWHLSLLRRGLSIFPAPLLSKGYRLYTSLDEARNTALAPLNPPNFDTNGEIHNQLQTHGKLPSEAPQPPILGEPEAGSPPAIRPSDTLREGGLKPFGHTRKGGFQHVREFAKYFASSINFGGRPDSKSPRIGGFRGPDRPEQPTKYLCMSSSLSKVRLGEGLKRGEP